MMLFCAYLKGEKVEAVQKLWKNPDRVLGFLFSLSDTIIFHPIQTLKPHFNKFKPLIESIKAIRHTAF